MSERTVYEAMPAWLQTMLCDVVAEQCKVALLNPGMADERRRARQGLEWMELIQQQVVVK